MTAQDKVKQAIQELDDQLLNAGIPASERDLYIATLVQDTLASWRV